MSDIFRFISEPLISIASTGSGCLILKIRQQSGPDFRSEPLCTAARRLPSGLDDIVLIVCFQLHSPVQILFDVKSVFLVVIGCVLVVGMLRDVVLVRKERSDAPELQDALAAVHDSQFIPAHQLPSILSSDEFRFGQKKYPLHSKPRFQTREYVVIKILTNRNLSESKIAFIAKALRYQSTLVLSSICNLYIQDLFSPIQFASF